MKKILATTLLILIISCQKNTSDKTPARSYTDSIMELSEKINKTDTVKITEKEKNNDKITERSEIYEALDAALTDPGFGRGVQMYLIAPACPAAAHAFA